MLTIPGCDSEGFLSSFLAAGLAQFHCRPATAGSRVSLGWWFSGECFVIKNHIWIHKSASFYQISWDRTFQNWCRRLISRDRDFSAIFEKMTKKLNFEKMIFSNFLTKFLLKNIKKVKKTRKIFRDGPAHWRARRPNFKFPDAIAKGFFLPSCRWLGSVSLPSGYRRVSGESRVMVLWTCLRALNSRMR